MADLQDLTPIRNHVYGVAGDVLPADEAVLRSLPDPGEPLKGGVRARNDSVETLAHLRELGLATSPGGWWRKTRAGVLFLREFGVHRSDPAGGTNEATA